MGRLIKGVNDLATVNPELAKEWHPTKNGYLRPEDVSAWDERKVWWMLPYDVPEDYPVEHLRGKHFDFEWESMVFTRHSKGAICPYLSKPAKGVWQGFNDLATVNPELAAQWHPTKNGDLTPFDVLAGNNQKAWWYLPYDVPEDYPVEHLRGKHYDFEWQASPNSRCRRGLGCPFLSGKAIWKGFNDLATVNPGLAKEWHPTKNGSLRPEDVTSNHHNKVWWYLPYDDSRTGKHFNFEWQATVLNRNYRGDGCPYLNISPAVWKGFNDLATVNPELAAEWHPTKNGDLTPSDVTGSCGKRVWWLLPYDVPEDYPIEHLRGKHFDFEWKIQIRNRNNGTGCPYLTNSAVWKGFNDLATVNPAVAAEWHPTKNGDLTASDVTYGSAKKVWWQVEHVDVKTGKHRVFEWKASISDRSKGHGCPYLANYKGELYVEQFLKQAGVEFEIHKRFDDLRGTRNGQLSYDFAISDDRCELILIEYNGVQHYKAIDYFGGDSKFKIQKQHDKLKREYAKKQGYKLITIKYTYDTYESVAEYLDEMLAA